MYLLEPASLCDPRNEIGFDILSCLVCMTLFLYFDERLLYQTKVHIVGALFDIVVGVFETKALASLLFLVWSFGLVLLLLLLVLVLVWTTEENLKLLNLCLLRF